MKTLRYLALAPLALAAANVAHADTHDVFGTFATPQGTSHVTIADCGDGTPCGTVSWIDPAAMPEGYGPEDALTRSGEQVLGYTILQGFDRKKKDWRGGTIYDPEADRSYAARLKRLANGDLQLKGCLGPMCQTQTWPSVAANAIGAAD